ncbi:MAG TPA: carboxylating nicotinate-nucleotide diphosphorylase [Gammaproteobacteria bacterium]|nr:carboxylating nicotinate-nucleotide diphosphorylase [Gammaproteobacteria bacterium]
MRAFSPPPAHTIADDVDRALAEDVGAGDITAALIPTRVQGQAQVISREAAVLCGRAWFDTVFARLDPAVEVDWTLADGAAVAPGAVLCHLRGPARALLSGERSALNFVQTLSGTATAARRYAEAVAGTGVKILDTRKTLPGLRAAQKYAVRCGGCHNHRLGLYDAFLIKENHIAATGSIAAAVAAARKLKPELPVEVEVESLAELDQALAAGADIALLDNFSLDMLRQAVARARGRLKLEASGNVSLDRVRAVALTGVDYISVGAITKHLKAVDLSMGIIPGG